MILLDRYPVLLRSSLLKHSLPAIILLASSVAPVRAQATFSKAEKPLATISRMLLGADLRDSVVEVAKGQVGARYRLGAKSPGKAFDCSGLVQWVMGIFGQDLPRTAVAQAHTGVEIPKDPDLLLPGDLLYFGKGKRIDHIGIYVGEGRFVHAATSSKGVVEANLPTGKLANTWWKGVRRLLDDDSTTIAPLTGSDTAVVKPRITT